MCGIFCSVRRPSADGHEDSVTLSLLAERLKAANALRGPDAQTTQCFHDAGFALEFFGSELRLRGNFPVVQPHIEGGDMLCWNGEIFDGDLEVSPEDNDGVVLFRKLRRRPDNVLDILDNVEGPYAFVFYDASSHRIVFGRDPLGRRSLLVHKPTATSPYLLLTSVTAGEEPGFDFQEVSADAIYSLDLVEWNSSGQLLDIDRCIKPLPRQSNNGQFASPLSCNSAPDYTFPSEDFPIIESLDVVPSHLVDPVKALIMRLDDSVKRRVQNIPPISGSDTSGRLGVLFSGGIDSAVLAFFAHKYVPLDEPIDLLNVAFENPWKIKSSPQPVSKKAKKKKPAQGLEQESALPKKPYMVPDRVIGLEEVEELRRVCPGRRWNFVEVNVPYEESQAAIPTIKTLMLPNRTVMDLSLASALYFASRGVGLLSDPSETTETKPYTSKARVLLSGLGSDELFGGYSRHRTTFNQGGWKALVDELQLEIIRIPSRNLGRDDRIVSSHGKEIRHPFLSLSFVQCISLLPVHHKLDPRGKMGVGEKLLLRLATRKLGLVIASTRKKKAMQFGSHAARMGGEKKGDVLLD